jgi:hypothetical protein
MISMDDSLPMIDPGVPERTAWQQLTDEERSIVALKLGVRMNGGRITGADLEVAGLLFDGRFTGTHPRDTKAIVTGVKNFIDNAGGRFDSDIWRQIATLENGWSGKNNSAGVAFQVASKRAFLETLARNGYDVDRWYERFNRMNNHRHSARFVTETSYETSMHLIQERGYDSSRFDVHWDPRSSAFRRWDSKNYPNIGKRPVFMPGRIREQIAAGLSHKNPLSAAETREELRRMGIVPANGQLPGTAEGSA